jgi:SAM-dependent methyltransferase
VSKAPHDDPPHPSNDASHTPVADIAKGHDGAVPRRIRSAAPRERSGPIGITSGDFSTPVVRKRTTTQPRGVPVLGPRSPLAAAAAAAEVGDSAPDVQPTPAPETTAMGAVPAMPVVEATPGAISTRPPPPPPPPDDSPFSDEAVAEERPEEEPDSEAAALAAEAAAVRALDVGPMTPPPELVAADVAPAVEAAGAQTPPPEVVALAAPAEPEIAAPTPPPEVQTGARTPAPEIAAPTPPPEVQANNRTPPPSASASARTPPPEFPTVVRTPAPELLERSRTPAPEEAARAGMAPAVAPPPGVDFDDLPTPPPQAVTAPAPSGHGALPVDSMAAEGSGGGAVSDLPAEALSDVAGDAAAADPEVDSALTEHEFDGDDVEVMDGTEQARAIEFADGQPTRQPKYATPPPIPGSYLKTPGPEPIVMPGEPSVVIPGLPILPEPLAQRPRRPKRSKPWFEEVFDEDYLRTLPFMRPDQTLREVEFIADALKLGSGAEILDVACGYGRHAIELVQRDFNVTGLDLSLPLLIRAADEAQRRELTVNFVHADMREMAFEKQFDGAYSMLTSFGYFDEDTNLRVAERIGRALKPGARFLLDVVNRDYVVADLPVRVWWEGTGCVVLEEVDFNFHTSRIVTHRSIVFEDGRQLEQELSVRAYSLHEIGRLLRQAGFRVMDVSGGLATRGQFFGAASRSLLIVAEKRDSDSAQPL